jgi:hypothetical protein
LGGLVEHGLDLVPVEVPNECGVAAPAVSRAQPGAALVDAACLKCNGVESVD